MTTFSVVEDASVGASGVSGGVVASVKANILAAAELWNRYFVQGSFDIKIELRFEDIGGSTLATGGSGLSFSGFGGAGLEVWKVDSMEEYITGGEVGGSAVDITITVDTPKLLADEFFFDPAPFSRTSTVPGGKNDFMSVMLHEVGHGLGFLSISTDGMDTVDDNGSPADMPDVTPFDLWVDPDAAGGRSFVGPKATALFGGDILLDPGSDSHIAKASDGGFENLMDPSLLVGSRSYIAPIHIAIFEDIGIPVRKPTTGADDLFGFDFFDDSISLLGGADEYSGLTGDDTVFGGAGADRIFGNAGKDELSGGAGADFISGGNNADTLYGNTGNDTLQGALGADRIFGADGNDDLRGSDGADSLSGGEGLDTLTGGAGNDTLFGARFEDELSGGAGDDSLNAGNNGDVASGNGGNDTVNGGNGSDVLSGNDGNDVVIAAKGFDTVFGNAGDDTLIGGNADDTLTGGTGDDQFNFNITNDDDVITDFTPGAATEDVIRLSGFGAAFDTFAEVLAAASQVGLDTVIDFGGGDTITLSGVTVGSLASDDFVFA